MVYCGKHQCSFEHDIKYILLFSFFLLFLSNFFHIKVKFIVCFSSIFHCNKKIKVLQDLDPVTSPIHLFCLKWSWTPNLFQWIHWNPNDNFFVPPLNTKYFQKNSKDILNYLNDPNKNKFNFNLPSLYNTERKWYILLFVH